MKYEYCTTGERAFDKELNANRIKMPSGGDWEFVAFSVGAGGISEEFNPCGLILWRRPIP